MKFSSQTDGKHIGAKSFGFCISILCQNSDESHQFRTLLGLADQHPRTKTIRQREVTPARGSSTDGFACRGLMDSAGGLFRWYKAAHSLWSDTNQLRSSQHEVCCKCLFWAGRNSDIRCIIVVRTFILVSCVRLHTTFRPVASPAVIRCWLVQCRTNQHLMTAGEATGRNVVCSLTQLTKMKVRTTIMHFVVIPRQNHSVKPKLGYKV